MSISNENIVVKDKNGEVIHKSSCYRLFAIFVIGDTSITTPVIKMAKKFMFSIYLMNSYMKLYEVLGSRMEGNTLLRIKQYEYNDYEIGKYIIINKMVNQLNTLKRIRNKSSEDSEIIKEIQKMIDKFYLEENLNVRTIMGYEGSVAKKYFSSLYKDFEWKNRKPRIKSDYINATMDIGYNILFNLVDALLSTFGFDNYCGVLHSKFFNRKSLVCDIIEPIRPVIDYKIRKNINLGVFKESDFKKYDNRYVLEWKKSKKYVKEFSEVLNEYKDEIFSYIQGYYRAFMRNNKSQQFPVFEVI